ncbi:general transcription factor II-I repeat domain-containing protein 2A-like [Neoarius graeffei]|uniref:general transcription factor II-I repeat domain-containing protein 2A-like n=1 Tax=Neoarius graeffei TaxID=443677 RepID=UPI00298C51AD|nr:general transcription factor II-I repeat domain-containing protein 2A-like [Neoarius graeffei]
MLGLKWDKLAGVTTDGCPNLMGKNVGLLKRMQDKVTEMNPVQKLTFLHCIIHQEVLCKTVLKMNHVVDAVTKTVNFIRVRALNHRQFVAFLEENEIEHGDISYHCTVRWLSLGKVLKSVWDLRDQIQDFCVKKGHDIPELSDKDWVAALGFAVDVTALMNELNVKLQCKGLFVHEMYSAVNAFMRKLQLLSSQVKDNILTHLPTLKEATRSADHLHKYSTMLEALQISMPLFKPRTDWIILTEEVFAASENAGSDSSLITDELSLYTTPHSQLHDVKPEVSHVEQSVASLRKSDLKFNVEDYHGDARVKIPEYNEIVAVFKDYNLNRHYTTKHEDKYRNLSDEESAQGSLMHC